MSQTCPYLKKCGACSSIGMDYAETLREKERRVAGILRPYVRLSGITGMEDPYYYRNKVHRVCAYERMGRSEKHMAGIYAEGTHKIVPVKHCLIENRQAQEIIEDVLGLVRDFKIRIYNEDTGVGLLRHILVRTAHKTGEILLVLVLTSPVLPGKKNFVKALISKHPEITSIVINVNNRTTSQVLGDREEAAYGPGFIVDELCGKRFRISGSSFYQVNSVQTENLYRQAIAYANLTGRETVVDAYCGIGTIGIAASDGAGKLIGIESNRSAVRDAVTNMKQNRIKNAVYVCEDAGTYLEKMAAERVKADVVFMDPPRSGSSEQFLSSAAAVSPGRIVYISCNPETLARDLQKLTKLGYRVREARAFDMFPFTREVEVCCLLTKN